MEKSNQNRYQMLASKWQQGTISPDERAEFDAWYYAGENIYQMPTEESEESAGNRLFHQIQIKAGIAQKPASRKKLWSRIAIAASMILIGGSAYFYYHSLNHKNTADNTIAYASDIAPGTNGATLTLANGKKISLRNASNGQLASEAGVAISKTKSGEIIYEIKEQTESSQVSTNILSTAKGETYQVVLPDGTKVWLNAASTLKYPSSFTGQSTRKITLDGEAYFEVAKDAAHPFIVSSAKQNVQVLGTHFNIEAYSDEPEIKTTLLEGSVKVASTNAPTEKILKPDQQAEVTGSRISVKKVDGEDAIAWKNGIFFFEDETLETIMKKVSRWYNIEVVYAEGVNKNELYMGTVSRYDKISKVLSTMELTKNVHFKIDGRRITVMR